MPNTLAINEVKKCEKWSDYSELASDWSSVELPFCVAYLTVWCSLEELHQMKVLNPAKVKDFKIMKSIILKFLENNEGCLEVVEERLKWEKLKRRWY